MGTPVGHAPKPLPIPRRRLSRRRRRQRIIVCVLVAVFVVWLWQPALRNLGYLPRLGKKEVTMQWRVVRIAGDRRSVDIRVDLCARRLAGVDVTRMGENAVLTVFTRADLDADEDSCPKPAAMPTHLVPLGFALPTDGRVLDGADSS